MQHARPFPSAAEIHEKDVQCGVEHIEESIIDAIGRGAESFTFTMSMAFLIPHRSASEKEELAKKIVAHLKHHLIPRMEKAQWDVSVVAEGAKIHMSIRTR